MARRFLALAICSVVIGNSIAGEATALFNGSNLDGWVPMHGGDWSVEDGVIVGRNGGNWSTDPEKSGSWLRTENEYSDFIWEFEFAINKKGNGGVFLRSRLTRNPAFTGHEVQILDDHGRPPQTWTTGALYDVVAPHKNLSKPAGEWNKVRIHTTGPRIRVWMNGEQVVDHISQRRKKGYLGLQAHDEVAVIRFRNVHLTDLSKRSAIRVGIIGLDTSHAPAFAKVINDQEAADMSDIRVVAAYPKGSPDIESSVSRVPAYTKQLEAMGVEIVPSIDELLSKVDAVLLETNDGRPHLEQVRPVLEAGKPVFIDKPMAGTLADVLTIANEAKAAGVPIFSSSSLRYVAKAQAIRHGEIGDVLGCTTYSPCALEATHPDLYWYGIHGVELLFTIMGPGCERVTRVTTDGTDVVVGTWKDGRIGTYRGQRDGKRGYGGIAFGEKAISDVGEYAGYKPLVREIVKFFRTGVSPVEIEETLEIYAFMEAADESKRQGGASVSLTEVRRNSSASVD